MGRVSEFHLERSHSKDEHIGIPVVPSVYVRPLPVYHDPE